MSDNFLVNEKYQNTRGNLLSSYVEQMTLYLSKKYPEKSNEDIKKFVIKTAQEKFHDPEADVVLHPEPGVSNRVQIPLSQHYKNNIKQHIATPSGTVYLLPSEKESLLRLSLGSKLAERKVFKKKYINALESGDMVLANINNNLQSSTKVFCNSALGAMKSPFNILYDLAGFNGVTSIARLSVKYGYAYTERFLRGNLYFKNSTSAFAYLNNLISVIPDNISDIIKQFKLHVPSVDVIYNYIITSLGYYTLSIPKKELLEYISTFTDEQKCFVLYAGCFRNILIHNDTLMRRFFDKFFDTTMEIDPNDDPKDIFKVEETLLSLITSLNYEFLGYAPDGMRNNVEMAIKNNPDSVRKLIAIARHMNSLLEKISPLFKTFLRINSDFGQLYQHSSIVRKCVMISDTDSVIFSTQNLVEWYTKENKFSPKSYQINMFTVYLLSRNVEHIFARLSSGFGMIDKDIVSISMKNEFFYPVMMKTRLAKHYAGIILFQEGKLLATPKKDIKGVNLRSSVLPKETRDLSEEFLSSMFSDLIRDGTLSARTILQKVSNFENTILDSIRNGEKRFLQSISIDTKDKYEDPMSISQYFAYEFWQRVFVPEFDGIILPNKAYKLPLRDGGKILRSQEFHEKVKEYSPGMYQRLLDFQNSYPNKNGSSILIPLSLPNIPELFRDIIDIRSIIFSNGGPYYLVLSSLGLPYTFNKSSYAVSDFYSLTPFDLKYN